MPAPLVDDVHAIFQAAITAVQPSRLLDDGGERMSRIRAWAGDRRLRVVGMGKAARSMAGVVERRLGDRVADGLVAVPGGYARGPMPGPAPRRIAVVEAGHPVPTSASQQAARRMRALAEACMNEDALLVLVSGGGSALTAEFAEGISLDEGQAVFQALLTAGVDIHAMNAVRKHMTRLGGGRLAAAAAPAPVYALVISDVVGDDLATIASGPTVPDPTTFAEAIAVLRDAEIWMTAPRSVRAHLQAGARGDRAESLKPGDPVVDGVQTHLVGTNREALSGARTEAERRGYAVVMAGDPFTGEARAVGRAHARILAAAEADTPRCMLWGGETTVTVTGTGRGGRNQEATLAAAQVLADAPRPIAFLSGGTDGIDGPTDAAGAWATPQTLRRARQQGLDPDAHLQANNSYPFFEALDALVKTGPTHTNVMDVQVGLIA